MPKSKGSTNKEPYYGLESRDVSLGKRGLYEKEDYRDKLSPEELAWLAEFNQGYYNGVFYKKGSTYAMKGGPRFDKKHRLRKLIQREHYKRKQDIWNIVAAHRANREALTYDETPKVSDGAIRQKNIDPEEVIDFFIEIRKTCSTDEEALEKISEIMFSDDSPRRARKK